MGKYIINEYGASEGMVLFSLNTFNSCIGAMCRADKNPNFIEVRQEDAAKYEQMYLNSIKDILSNDEVGIDNLKQAIINEITNSGYNIKNIVKPIIHK